MLTLVYAADGTRLVAIYNNGKLAKQSSAGITESELLKLLGFHGKAIMNSNFDSDDMKIPLILPTSYDKYDNYSF